MVAHAYLLKQTHHVSNYTILFKLRYKQAWIQMNTFKSVVEARKQIIGSVTAGICFARFNEITRAPCGSAVRFRRTRNMVG